MSTGWHKQRALERRLFPQPKVKRPRKRREPKARPSPTFNPGDCPMCGNVCELAHGSWTCPHCGEEYHAP